MKKQWTVPAGYELHIGGSAVRFKSRAIVETEAPKGIYVKLVKTEKSVDEKLPEKEGE